MFIILLTLNILKVISLPPPKCIRPLTLILHWHLQKCLCVKKGPRNIWFYLLTDIRFFYLKTDKSKTKHRTTVHTTKYSTKASMSATSWNQLDLLQMHSFSFFLNGSGICSCLSDTVKMLSIRLSEEIEVGWAILYKCEAIQSFPLYLIHWPGLSYHVEMTFTTKYLSLRRLQR